MDLTTLKKKVLKLGNQYSIKGVLVSDLKNADNINKINDYADACQKELSGIRKIETIKHFVISPIPNQVSGKFQQHLDEDIVFTAQGTKAYYFEADKPFILTITINGVMPTIGGTITGIPTEMTAFKGLISTVGLGKKDIDPTDTVTLTFSGDYPYNLQNVAMYAYKFSSADDIPPFNDYMQVQLPDDFRELKEVKVNNITTSDYFIKDGYLNVNSSLIGNADLIYYRFPQTISDDTDPSYTFELDAEACELIPYYVAAHIFMRNDPSIATMMLNEYENKRDRLQDIQINSTGRIKIRNVWGGYSGL